MAPDMIRPAIALFAGLLGLILPAMAAAEPAHVLALRDLLARTVPEHNRYGGGAATIDWRTGEVRVVCSSLLVLTLQHCYGCSDAEITAWFAERRPEAADIHAGLATGRSPFIRVARVDALLPGDVISFDYRSGGKLPTGHIMTVDAAPRALAAGRWAVAVLDASSSPHGAGDTRPADGEGLGRGTIALFAGADGAPTGYAWTAGKATLHAVADRPIILARWPAAR